MERESPTSLYAQIAATLREEILAARFEPSGRLPSEEELRERFEVSRVTVRQALGELEEAGLVERRKGKGTFTRGKRVQHSLDLLLSFHESLKAQGFDASMHFIESAVTAPRHGLSARVVRLHLADGKPIALGTSLLPAALAKQNWKALNHLPLYTIIEQHLGVALTTAEFAIGMGVADRHAAQQLHVDEGQRLLVLERSSYDDTRRLLDLSTFQVCAEHYQFSVTSRITR